MPASSHQSTKHICIVARTTSWCKIWDHALDRGARGDKANAKALQSHEYPSLRYMILYTQWWSYWSELFLSGPLSESHLNISTYILRPKMCGLPQWAVWSGKKSGIYSIKLVINVVSIMQDTGKCIIMQCHWCTWQRVTFSRTTYKQLLLASGSELT